MLTRIRTDQILNKEVRKEDLADNIIDASKLELPNLGSSGDLLTTDGSGNLLFVTPTLSGLNDTDFVTTPPQNGDVLAYDSNIQKWVPFAANLSPTGFSKTFVVNNITERNLLSPNSGDQVFVRTSFDGEWEMFLWDSVGGTWVSTTTRDAASTDSRTIEVLVDFNDTPGPVLLGNISQGSRVTLVTVEVTQAFDGTPSLTVGDAGDNERLMSNDFHDLSETGTYNLQTDYVYTDILDTDVYTYFNPGGASIGEARVLVTYV